MMERSPRAPVLRASALRAIALSADTRIRARRHPSEQLLVLLDERVLGLGQDLDQRVFGQLAQVATTGRATHQFRDQAKLDQVFRFDLAEQSETLRSDLLLTVAAKPIPDFSDGFG